MFTFVTEWKVLSCRDALEELNPSSVTAASVCQAPGVLWAPLRYSPKEMRWGDAPARGGDVAWEVEQGGMRLSSPGGPR